MPKEFPFKPEDNRTANYWIVQFLQWRRDQAESEVENAIYKAVLADWMEVSHMLTERYHRQMQDRAEVARRASAEKARLERQEGAENG